MGISRGNGITYNYTGWGRQQAPSAFDYTESLYRKYGLTPSALSSPSSAAFEEKYGATPEWNEQAVRDSLYVDEREAMAQEMADYGDQMFDLFDQYQPHLEHIAENSGVSDAELASQLADSGARYNASVDAVQAEAERQLKRMGVNPNSGRYAALTSTNAIQKAAGYSMNQNQVRQAAQQQDRNERMQAASLGMQIAGQGANSYNAAGSTYGQIGSQLQNAKQFYDQMQEQSRQFDANYDQSNKQLGLSAMGQMFNQAQQRYNNGLQANYTRDAFGNVNNMNYTYGF